MPDKGHPMTITRTCKPDRLTPVIQTRNAARINKMFGEITKEANP